MEYNEAEINRLKNLNVKKITNGSNGLAFQSDILADPNIAKGFGVLNEAFKGTAQEFAQAQLAINKGQCGECIEEQKKVQMLQQAPLSQGGMKEHCRHREIGNPSLTVQNRTDRVEEERNQFLMHNHRRLDQLEIQHRLKPKDRCCLQESLFLWYILLELLLLLWLFGKFHLLL